MTVLSQLAWCLLGIFRVLVFVCFACLRLVSLGPSWPQTYYVAEDMLELTACLYLQSAGIIVLHTTMGSFLAPRQHRRPICGHDTPPGCSREVPFFSGSLITWSLAWDPEVSKSCPVALPPGCCFAAPQVEMQEWPPGSSGPAPVGPMPLHDEICLLRPKERPASLGFSPTRPQRSRSGQHCPLVVR